MAADKRGQSCRLARYCGYVSRSVGDVVSFGQVEQDEDVAERVCDDGHPADRDVEGLGHYPPAGCPDRGGCRGGWCDVGGRFRPVHAELIGEAQARQEVSVPPLRRVEGRHFGGIMPWTSSGHNHG
jgi:hypothetical protein